MPAYASQRRQNPTPVLLRHGAAPAPTGIRLGSTTHFVKPECHRSEHDITALQDDVVMQFDLGNTLPRKRERGRPDLSVPVQRILDERTARDERHRLQPDNSS